LRKAILFIFLTSALFVIKTSAQNTDSLFTQVGNFELHSTIEDDFIVKLPLDSFPQNFDAVKIKSDKLFYIFFHDSIYGHSDSNNEIILDIKSVKQRSRLSDVRVHFQNFKQQLFIEILRKSESKKSQLNIQVYENEVANRAFKDVFISLLLAIITILVVLRISYPKRFNEVFSFRRNFSLRPIESDNSRLRLFDQDGLMTAAVHALVLSLLILIVFNYREIISEEVERSQVLMTFLKTLLFISSALIIKVIVISLSSRLYRIGKINAYYIKEMINLGLLFGLLLFLFTVLVFLSADSLPNWSLIIIKNGIVVFYVARVFLLYFKILKLSGFTYLYLFSYFCSTEILPLIIGLKYFY